MIIREVLAGDIAALSELAQRTYAEAFGHSFSRSDLTAHLQNQLSTEYFRQASDADVILVADLDGSLIGYVQFGSVRIARVAASAEDQELRRLYVKAGFRGGGIGRRLLESALAHPRLAGAADIYLDVWERNDGARRFYEQFGFKVIGAHPLGVASGMASDLDLVMLRRGFL